MTTGYQLNMYKNIIWNTGRAAERARHNLRLKNKRRPGAKAPSSKRQASSALKRTQLNDIEKLERL